MTDPRSTPMTGQSRENLADVQARMPTYVSEWAREAAIEAMRDMEGEIHDGGVYALARWFDALRAAPDAGEPVTGRECTCKYIHGHADDCPAAHPLPPDGVRKITDEMVTAAMRAFERMSSVLRYREKDKWHSCDVMGMRDALRAALALETKHE